MPCPGALPPLIGWAASHGSLSIGGAALFLIVFLWQIPHFMAIAWLYRDDYGKAGFPMLPVVEPDGRRTGRQAVAYAVALVPASLVPDGHRFERCAYTRRSRSCSARRCCGWPFASPRREAIARRAGCSSRSITYLPLLWIVMMADKL